MLAGFIWLMGLAALLAAVTGQTDGLAKSLFVFVLGLGTIAAAWHFFPFQRYTFDGDAGAFSRRIARVTGATVDTLPLHEIERATLQSNWSDGTRMQRVALLTKTGPLPLEYGFVSSERKPVVEEINDWLQQRNR